MSPWKMTSYSFATGAPPEELQDGSNISGTLSKLHCCFKNLFFTNSFASSPVSRLSSLLTAVLLDKLIPNMYICYFVFTSMKSDDFQLCCPIEKKEEKNSRFIAATLYLRGTKRGFSLRKLDSGCCKAENSNLGTAPQWRPSTRADSDEETRAEVNECYEGMGMNVCKEKLMKEYLRATKPYKNSFNFQGCRVSNEKKNILLKPI